MPGTVLTDCKIYLGGYNLSGSSNQLSLEHGAEMLDDTVFGAVTTRSFKPGLKTVSMTVNGFWDSTLDLALYNRIGAVREVLTFAPVGNAEGDRSFFTRHVNGNYTPLGGEVGTLMPFEVTASSANAPMVRGSLLATGVKSVTGTSTGLNLGLLGTGFKAYSALHVVAVAATSIQVIVESDDAAPFATPTTRLTHTLITSGGGVAADWQELAGPVATDTFWRSKWTIVGGPFTIFHSFGIQ